jgi:hypothetical protein
MRQPLLSGVLPLQPPPLMPEMLSLLPAMLPLQPSPLHIAALQTSHLGRTSRAPAAALAAAAAAQVLTAGLLSQQLLRPLLPLLLPAKLPLGEVNLLSVSLHPKAAASQRLLLLPYISYAPCSSGGSGSSYPHSPRR